MAETLKKEDWTLIIEALAYYGGDPCEFDDYRQRRAWDLIDYVTAQKGIDACTRLREAMHRTPHWQE